MSMDDEPKRAVTKVENDWASPEMRDIAFFFKVEDTITWDAYREKVLDVLDWAKNRTGSNDKIDWLLEVRKLERELGIKTNLKERIDNIHRFCRLDSKRTSINKEMELLKNGTTNNNPSVRT
jgi:hypothetical protein